MSADKIQIVDVAARPALTIRATAKTLRMPKVMGDAFGKIKSHLDEQGAAGSKTDMPFCIYHNLDWDQLSARGLKETFRVMFMHRWDLEMGIPTGGPMQDVASMRGIDMPEGRHVKAIHLGPYMKVGEAYTRILAYAQEQQLKLKNCSIEIYANDPSKVRKDLIRTEVYVPLA